MIDMVSTRPQITIPGILGGLGPFAHLEFERKLLQMSHQRGASIDQAHPVWFLISATAIPDRTQSLAGQTESCTPLLVKYGHLLEAMGSHFMVVICNTAHALYQPVQAQLGIPWVHLMQCTTEYILENYPQVKTVGMLTTNGTLQSQLYEQSLNPVRITPLSPQLGSPLQSQIMASIYHPQWGIKATGTTVSDQAINILTEAVIQLRDLGAELIIAGCTELSVGLSRIQQLSIPWVDPLEILAQVTLELAYGDRPLLL